MVLSAIHFCVQSLHNLSPQSEIPRALNAYFSFHYENLKDRSESVQRVRNCPNESNEGHEQSSILFLCPSASLSSHRGRRRFRSLERFLRLFVLDSYFLALAPSTEGFRGYYTRHVITSVLG